jgi:branched-chain amino acid transport system substrate-binding protein
MTTPRGREPIEKPAGDLSRREFLSGTLAALPAKRAVRADLRVGLLLPAGPLGSSILRGARLGITEAASLAQMFGKSIDLAVPPATGPEQLAGAATRLIKDGVSVLVGGGDERAAETLVGIAREGKALFLNVGSASDRLRSEGCDRHTFHLHASIQMHVGAAGHWLIEEKKLRRWVVLSDSGEIRRAVTAFAAARGATIEEGALVVSGTTDWREALERVRAARPEAVWIGLRAAAVPDFLRQHGRSGLAGELVGITPDAIALPNAAGGTWPVMWHHTLEKYSARDLNGRYRRRFGRRLDGAGWSAWAALKLIGEGMLRAGTTPQALLEYLESDPPFDGHKGRPLTFRRWDHQLRQPMFLARAGNAPTVGGAPSEGEVIAEVPRGDLDAIALPPKDGDCRIA